MIDERIQNLTISVFLFIIVLSMFTAILFEEHKVSESVVVYIIHNPDGTQTHGNIIFNDNVGTLYPEVTSHRGTSILKAGSVKLSSNGTFEIVSVKHYRSYYKGGPLSKHKRKKK